MLPVLLDLLRVARNGPGRPRTRPDALLADKAYSSRGHRALLHERGITAVIPERADQQSHRLRRGLATRYDKLAVIYRGGAVLRSIILWLRSPIGDTP